MMRCVASMTMAFALLLLGSVGSAQEPSFDEHLQLAWILLQNESYDAAVEHYTAAARLDPAALDPWLGLQITRLEQNDPSAALEAGQRALALFPGNYWARLRQAYAHYLLHDFEAARALYQGLVDENKDDSEALLGLGAAQLKSGKRTGRRHCERALELLGDDPRVTACLSLSRPKPVLLTPAVGATYLRYSHPWNSDAVIGTSASAGLQLKNGLGLWIGGTYGTTILRYRARDFWQAGPGGGLFLSRRGLDLGLVAAWLGSSAAGVNGAIITGGYGGYSWRYVGASAAATFVVYPNFMTVQIDPRLRFMPGSVVALWAGPQLIILGDGHPRVSGQSTRPALLWSGHLGVDIAAHRMLTLTLSGFYGSRAYFVEDFGLSVWTSQDHFVGGFDARLCLTIASTMRLFLGWRQHFGDRQDGLAHEFSLLGPSLGFSAAF